MARPSPRFLVPVLVAVLVITSSAASGLFILFYTARRINDTITIGHRFPIDNLNPFIGFSNEAYLFYSLVYDFLFSLDEDQNYVPNLALGSSTPDGGLAWVYQVRQGVKWHDGTDMTAEDVNFTINYNIQAFWLLWAYEPYLNQVKQCRPGETSGCGAVVTAPSEVTVYFERPFSPGGSAMIFPILQKRQWQNITPSQAQYSFPNEQPIGTGPYRADPGIYNAWLEGRPLVLHANPDYHFGEPGVKRIVFQVFGDENAMVTALLRGDIDVAMLSAAGYGAVLSRKGSLPIELQEGLTVIQYWIDIGITQLNHPGINRRLNPARFDLSVRQALAHATDKEFVLRQFYLGKGVPGTSLVSPVAPFWHYEPGTEFFDYNLSKANAMLDAAGYDARDPDGIRKASRDISLSVYCSPENLANLCQTQITVPTDTRLSFSMVTRIEAPEERDVADYLQQNWRQIGVELTITSEEEITMNTDVYGGEYDTYIWWWSADADPNYILSIQSNFTLNGWSDNYYDNETYNGLYLAQLSALDLTQRQQYVHDAQKVNYLGAAFIILVYPYFHYAWWTDEYAGWGDMVADPGRQVGAFWGKHPLFMEMTYIGGPSSSLPLAYLTGGGASSGLAVFAGAALAVTLRKRRESEEAPPEVPPMAPPPT